MHSARPDREANFWFSKANKIVKGYVFLIKIDHPTVVRAESTIGGFGGRVWPTELVPKFSYLEAKMIVKFYLRILAIVPIQSGNLTYHHYLFQLLKWSHLGQMNSYKNSHMNSHE